MNVIEEVKAQLSSIPDARLRTTGDGVVVEPAMGGFEVALQVTGDSFLVSYEGWHERFSTGEKALQCALFGLSEGCRLRVTYRGDSPTSWTLESFTEGDWSKDSTTALVLVPFWRRKRVELKQNKLLAIKDAQSSSYLAWHAVSDGFVVEGSLRDIYAFDTDEATWSQFLSCLRAADYPCAFSHGGVRMEGFIERFDEAAALMQTDPVLLIITVGPIQLNCHFFAADEIELDLDPREVTDESRYQELLGFLRWMAAALARTICVTHENSPDEVILQVAPEGGITRG